MSVYYDGRDSYEDIINLPRHVSKTRPPMSQSARAAQFSSFAALKGYDDEVAEAARLTCKKRQLTDDQKAALDMKLNLLIEKAAERPFVEICYFVPDEKKEGGFYATLCGEFRRFDEAERKICLTDGTVIGIDDIFSMGER
ncbi:MAG: hypothetical protein ACI4J1_01895 [Ruminiclostridium sp.]